MVMTLKNHKIFLYSLAKDNQPSTILYTYQITDQRAVCFLLFLVAYISNDGYCDLNMKFMAKMVFVVCLCFYRITKIEIPSFQLKLKTGSQCLLLVLFSSSSLSLSAFKCFFALAFSFRKQTLRL